MIRLRNAETKREIFSISCLGVLLRGAWLIWGASLFVVMVGVFSPEIARFFNPELRDFWQDAAAYQAGESDALDRQGLVEKYGEEMVAAYLDSESTVLLVPSDKAQQLHQQQATAPEAETGDATESEDMWPSWFTYFAAITFVFPFLLLISYFPATSALRMLQLRIIRLAYVSPRHTDVVDTYTAALTHRRFDRAAYTYLVTLGWCLVQGTWVAFQQGDAGLESIIQTALGLLATAYVGGLWLFALNLVVDAVSIFLGSNPLAHLWDEIALMLISIPIWILVFQNAWPTAIVIGLAGLGQVILAKRIHQKLMSGGEDEAVLQHA